MIIYRYWPDATNYERLYVSLDDPCRLRFTGERFGSSWQPPALRLDERGLPLSDFPFLFHSAPVFSERAVQVLRPLLEGHIEALPLHIRGREFYIINVLEVIKCLDHSRSAINYNSWGGVSSISRYVFLPGSVNNRHFFKIPETPTLEVLVSEIFRQVVESNGLIGFGYTQLPMREPE